MKEVVQLPGRLSSAFREILRGKGRPWSVDPQLEWGVLLPDHTRLPPSAPTASPFVSSSPPVARKGNPRSPGAARGRLNDAGTGAGPEEQCFYTQRVSQGLGNPGPEGPIHHGAHLVPQGLQEPGAGPCQADGNALLPTVCVEIKPKWGAPIPPPGHPSGGSAVFGVPSLGAAPLPDSDASPLPDLEAAQLPRLDAPPLHDWARPISRFRLKQLLKMAQVGISPSLVPGGKLS